MEKENKKTEEEVIALIKRYENRVWSLRDKRAELLKLICDKKLDILQLNKELEEIRNSKESQTEILEQNQ